MRIEKSLIGLSLLTALAFGLSGCGSSSGGGGGSTPVLASIAITPATLEIGVGSTQVFTASGTDDHGNPMAISPDWTLSTAEATALEPIGTLEVSGASCTFTASAAGSGNLTAASSSITSNVVTITVTSSPTPPPTPASGNILFIHRSVGANLLDQGAVRDYISGHSSGLALYDYDVNNAQLYGPTNFEDTGTDYGLGGTEPVDYGHLWTSSETEWAVPRNLIMTDARNFKVIAFKSCYTACDYLNSRTDLADYQEYYTRMVDDFFAAHPEKIFVLMSPPPLRQSESNPEKAALAREFADWLSGLTSGHSNILYFNLFDQFAGADNYLKDEYEGEDGSHPNEHANQVVGPVFAQFLINAAAH